jgi:hypothetical protein
MAKTNSLAGNIQLLHHSRMTIARDLNRISEPPRELDMRMAKLNAVEIQV